MIKLLFMGTAFCLFVAWIIDVMRGGAQFDADQRRQMLVERARALWPQLDLCAALDCLYAQTLREIREAFKAGKDTWDMQDNLYAILNERNRLLTEENNSQEDSRLSRLPAATGTGMTISK